jgi:chaperonin GroES
MTVITPLSDRVLVVPAEKQTTTATGLFLPESAQEKPQQGYVIAIGNGMQINSENRIPMDVQVGDKVLFAKYIGTEVKIDGERVFLMRQADIMAVILDDEDYSEEDTE